MRRSNTDGAAEQELPDTIGDGLETELRNAVDSLCVTLDVLHRNPQSGPLVMEDTQLASDVRHVENRALLIRESKNQSADEWERRR